MMATMNPSRKAFGGALRIETFKGINYKTVGGRSLQLDLHLPTGVKGKIPLVFYIHGGGWASVTKEDATNLESFIREGWAMSAMDYRFSKEARFPAQMEDVNAALRWLRAHADEFNLDPERFVVWGHSAGAHLAALMALTGESRVFDTGENLHVSSKILAVGCVSPPVDLDDFGHQESAKEMVVALLGGTPGEKKDLAALASPLSHAKKGEAPPFLFVHGDKDDIVPLRHSEKLHELLVRNGLSSQLVVQPGVDHFNFNHPDMVRELIRFFGPVLKG